MIDIERLIQQAVARDYARVEEACERALQGGEHGVKVIRRSGLLVSAEPDPDVPYGEIHEHLDGEPQ